MEASSPLGARRQPHITRALRMGEEEEQLEGERGSGARGGAGLSSGSPGWMLPTLGERGWAEEAALGLRNGAADPAGQPGLWGIPMPTPPCCHRCSPSTLQLQEMMVEQIFLLLQPLGAAGLLSCWL